jgi:hypothetical protein
MNNKTAGMNNLPINAQSSQQNAMRNSPNKFNFMVNKKQQLYNNDRYNSYLFNAIYMNTRLLYKSKDFINTLKSEDVNFEKKIENKVDSNDLTKNITEILQSYTSTEIGTNNVGLINQTIKNAMDELKAEKQQMLDEINIHSNQAISLMNKNMNTTIENINNSVNSTLQNALQSINSNTNLLNNTINDINTTLHNSLQEAVEILNENNTNISTSLQSALVSIENKTQQSLHELSLSVNTNEIKNVVEEAISTINIEKQQALVEINTTADNAISNITNLVDDDSFIYEIKNELLQKIDYIFEMFFHANSNIIMDNYPI